MKTLTALILALFLVGCAARAHSPSIDAMGELTIIQHAETYPVSWEVAGDTHQKHLDNLKTWAAARYITIAFVPSIVYKGDELMGFSFYRQAGWSVLIDNSQPVNTQFYTLCHELAHVYQAHNLSKAASEVFAEIVAYQVAKNVGLQTRLQAALYLSPLGTEFEWTVVERYDSEADAVVNMLTTAAKGGL